MELPEYGVMYNHLTIDLEDHEGYWSNTVEDGEVQQQQQQQQQHQQPQQQQQQQQQQQYQQHQQDQQQQHQQPQQQQQQYQQHQQQQHQHQQQGQQPQDGFYSDLILSDKLPYKLINMHISNDKFNQDEVLLVHTLNAIGCKNYGLVSDIVEKYPYGNVAGYRYTDMDLKSIACERDRSEVGTCIINGPPSYHKGPTIATLISQYGIGKALEENKLANKILKTCTVESFTQQLTRDTLAARLSHFNKALFSLGTQMKRSEYKSISKIILPMAIGRGTVDEMWMIEYYPIILKFFEEMKFHGKQCYFAVKKSYLNAIDNFVSRKCSYKAVCRFGGLKTCSWVDMDDKWFSEIVRNKEEELLDNMSQRMSYDVPDTQFRY